MSDLKTYKVICNRRYIIPDNITTIVRATSLREALDKFLHSKSVDKKNDFEIDISEIEIQVLEAKFIE